MIMKLNIMSITMHVKYLFEYLWIRQVNNFQLTNTISHLALLLSFAQWPKFIFWAKNKISILASCWLNGVIHVQVVSKPKYVISRLLYLIAIARPLPLSFPSKLKNDNIQHDSVSISPFHSDSNWTETSNHHQILTVS